MVDGLDPEYLSCCPTPRLRELADGGFMLEAKAMMPTVTNVNNVSLITASYPQKHGITSNYWLKIKVVGTKSNRDGFGSRIIVSAGSLRQFRYVDGGDSGGGFQSSLPVHFGLGTADRVDRIEVKWPSGIVTILNDIPANQMLTIVEGEQDPNADYALASTLRRN